MRCSSARGVDVTTGLHTGEVGFTVDVLEVAPPLDPAWEEIVEVSFVNGDEIITLRDLDMLHPCDLPLAPGTYRVRYSARNMDKGWKIDTIANGEPVDFYSLIFWPAPVTPDTILKQTYPPVNSWHHRYRPKPGPSDSKN